MFLGWDEPFLPRVVEYFAHLETMVWQWDLSDWILALPTSHAVVQLSRRFRAHAERHHLDLRPPTLVTAGELPELLYTGDRPAAIEFEQTLAWARVLKRQPADRLRPLLPVLPETQALAAWLELSGTLRRLATDLASHGVEFATVRECLELEAEQQRWKLLEALHQEYLSELADANLADPYQQRDAASRTRKVVTARRIALVGTSDLNESITKVVASVESSPGNDSVVCLIAAPENRSELFDRLGRLRAEAFADYRLPLEDEHLIAASDVGDQASAAVEIVEQFAKNHAVEQMVIGVTDPSQIPATEIELESVGRSPYRYSGWTLRATAPGRLLDCVSEVLTKPTWRSLAALVRHGDAHRYLSEQLKLGDSDFLVSLDRLLTNHFPVHLADPLPSEAIDKCGDAVQLSEATAKWLSVFLGADDWSEATHRSRPQRSIAQWCTVLQQWLAVVYPQPSEDDPLTEQPAWSLNAAAVAKANELLERFSTLSGDLDEPVTSSVGLEMISGRLAELQIAAPEQSGQIAIRGWLDLAMDDAPAMVVIGLNHPFVPSAVTSDPFLPGSIRSQLRIGDNERRYARDVYAMQLMLSTRREVRFIVGKTAADRSPTPPSRLLAATAPADLARRVQLLLEGTRDSEPVDSLWCTDRDESDLPIATLDVSECPISMMSVTAFKSYLECPYRFYLRHVLRLKPLDDATRELAANQFGDLIHGAVEDFGRSDAKDEVDEDRIYEALRHYLHRYAARHFGDHVEPAVTLQIRQAERRLRGVAREQARRIAKGWRIYDTEASVSAPDVITVPEGTMGLVGRFDRIDHNEQTGQWAILDYKTHGHLPEKKHLKKNRKTGREEWVDLQLPLYQWMVPLLKINVPPEEVQLGYFNVSDKDEETKINIATFSPELMADAKQLIRDCVRGILRCEFQAADEQVQYDDYAMILQTDVASRMLATATADDQEDVR